MIYELLIEPHTKPRMTRSDKWKQRPCVIAYRDFKDKLREECKRINLTELKPELELLRFEIPMPSSWSKKKKLEMEGKPHQQSPDLDNLCKGFWDAMLTQDNYIWKVKELSKIWAIENRIILEQN